MYTRATFPLRSIEPRLRTLLPADLYAATWVDASLEPLQLTLDHLRALLRILTDYVPPPVTDMLRESGDGVVCQLAESTLLFTDLAGFTPLMEANVEAGRAGARALLDVLNDYFATMIEITSKSGGMLLEFTGDALLIQFPVHRGKPEISTAQAVRTGLRMQRAMSRYTRIETPQGPLSIKMRVGIHTGSYLAANIGTPMRMEHVLLGENVRRAKLAEGAGAVDRVCLTETSYELAKSEFRFEKGPPGYWFVVDDFTDESLGAYELLNVRARRLPRILMLDRSQDGLVTAIEQAVELVEPLASYLPQQLLKVVVESALHREIPPVLAAPTMVFVNLIGLAEQARPDLPQAENDRIAAVFSRAVALINAAVEARDGMLKKVTYHLSGSDMMLIFGVPRAHTDDAARAAHTALAIRQIVAELPPLDVDGRSIAVSCKIGMAQGQTFAAEVGSPRGRREYNVLGDVVNTAARLMAAAYEGQILMTDKVYYQIESQFECEALGPLTLKGKTISVPIFALHAPLEA